MGEQVYPTPPLALLIRARTLHAGLYELQWSPVEGRADGSGSSDGADGPARRRVEHVFFAFGPMLHVLSLCRGVVAADATFMTGSFKSTLYTIVGKDASNHLVPAAFMLSWTSESGHDWVTFLEKMQPRMPHVEVCISDAAKGLIEGVAAAGWRHSRCVLHMLKNMQAKRIAGSLRAGDLATLARQCRATDFDYVLRKILLKVPLGARARAQTFLREQQENYSAVKFVPQLPRYGDTLNNAAECFNSILVRRAAGQARVKDMGWLSVIKALRAKAQKWHKERYARG